MDRTKDKPVVGAQAAEQSETAVNLVEEIRRQFKGGPFISSSYIEKLAVMTRPELEAELTALDESQQATLHRISSGNYPSSERGRSHWGGGPTTEYEDIAISRHIIRRQAMVDFCLKKIKTPER